MTIKIDKSVVNSDKFLDMPKTTQLLYFRFLLEADADGFVNKHGSIIRANGFGADDYQLLLNKEFVCRGTDEKGDFCAVFIKDWKGRK